MTLILSPTADSRAATDDVRGDAQGFDRLTGLAVGGLAVLGAGALAGTMGGAKLAAGAALALVPAAFIALGIAALIGLRRN